MSQFSYDVAVAYRIYPKISKSRHSPQVFPKDKLKLAEFCLKSFKNSLGGVRIKLWVLLDNCPPAYEKMFTELWPSEDLVLMRYPGVLETGPHCASRRASSWSRPMRKLCYFAEDDYFYLPDQFPLIVDFLKQNPDADFVAPLTKVRIFIRPICTTFPGKQGSFWRERSGIPASARLTLSCANVIR
jgi:hypothetical protein